jgi:hypothetical protein
MNHLLLHQPPELVAGRPSFDDHDERGWAVVMALVAQLRSWMASPGDMAGTEQLLDRLEVEAATLYRQAALKHRTGATLHSDAGALDAWTTMVENHDNLKLELELVRGHLRGRKGVVD